MVSVSPAPSGSTISILSSIEAAPIIRVPLVFNTPFAPRVNEPSLSSSSSPVTKSSRSPGDIVPLIVKASEASIIMSSAVVKTVLLPIVI